MLQRFDIPGLSFPKDEISLFSYCEAKDDSKYLQKSSNRMLLHRHRGVSFVEESSYSSSVLVDNNSWSDCNYTSTSSNALCYSLSTSTSTLIDIQPEKSSMISNSSQRTFAAEFELYYADRLNENDARNAIDNVTLDQDGLTDDEITLFGDEIDMELASTDENHEIFTPLNEFTKDTKIHFVNQKSLLSSLLLLHSPPASASSSTLSLHNASSFTNSGSSNVTMDTNNVLSSSLKQCVHWENIQNSGPAGRLRGFQKTSTPTSSSSMPIKKSFDTSTSCW